jgi:hypothetical protein
MREGKKERKKREREREREGITLPNIISLHPDLLWLTLNLALFFSVCIMK